MKHTNADPLYKRVKYFKNKPPLIIESMNYSIFIISTLLFSSFAIMLANDGSSLLAGSQPHDTLDAPCCGPDPINGTMGTPLYMKGSDASNGRLSKDFPGDNISETASILPDTGIYEQHLGSWTSEPLGYEWCADGFMQMQVAAYGNGYSYTTDMRFEIMLDSEVVEEVEVHENPLRPSLKFWIANITLTMTVEPGQTVGFSLYVRENGPGGELRWDAISSPGMMWFHAQSTVVSFEDDEHDGKHTTTINVFSPWGSDDVDDIGAFVAVLPENPGDDLWSDINNGTLFTTEGQFTIDWTIMDGDNDAVIGIWVWKEPQELSSFAMIVCYASDGGEVPTFRGETYAGSTENASDDITLMSGLNGGMFFSGVILLICFSVYFTMVKNKRQDNEISQEINDWDWDCNDVDPESSSGGMSPGKVAVIGVIAAVLLIIAPIFNVMLESKEGETQDFTLTSIDGETFRLSDFRGKVVFLDFGGTKCSGCEEVLQHMKAIYPKVKDKGVVFISINVVPSESDSDLKAWRDEKNIPTENWIIAQDTADLIVKYNAFKIPRLLVIDKEGYITYEHTGAVSESIIEDEIEAAIEGNAIPIETKQYGLWILAFLAGVAMFFSPCAFPLLPGYMMLYFNVKEDDPSKKKEGYYRALKTGIIAAFGIFTVILFYGILFSLASDLIGDIDLDLFANIVIIALFSFGIMMLTEIQYSFLTNPIHQVKQSLFTSFEKLRIVKATQTVEKMIGRATNSDFTFQNAKENGQLGI